MREFAEQPMGNKVDLDNPETYSYLPKTTKELDNLMFREIGMAVCYMDYFHPDIFNKEHLSSHHLLKEYEYSYEDLKTNKPDQTVNCGYYQRLRVYELIKNFTSERRNNYENVLWYQEQVFIFQNETENMC